MTTGKNSKRKTESQLHSRAKTGEPRTHWKRVRSLKPAQIRAGLLKDPDALPTDAAFWAKAKVVMPRAKRTVTMRLDADLLDWFRRNRGYQTRINAVLRAYMNAQAGQR